jgi:membrane associated rhomboid family serine protease
VRRRNDLASFFTFGGRVPATVGFVLALMLLGTVWARFDSSVAVGAALMPIAVERGEVWRLVTWVIVQPDAWVLLFGGFMLWWIGQQLSFAWSERRFALRFLATTLFAGVVTSLLGILWSGGSTVAHLGMWPVVNALLVSWALLHPEAQLNVWGVLPVSGRNVALIVTGGTVLFAFFSPRAAEFAPHVAALGLAWAQARGVSAGGGRTWRQAKRWWADREAKRRSRHLKVVRKNGSDGRSDWMN